MTLNLNNLSVALTLAADVNSGATTLTTTTATTAWPTVPFHAMLSNPVTPTTYELVLVTAKTSTTLTVTRAFGSTTAAAWNAGTVIRQVATAEILQSLQPNVKTLGAKGDGTTNDRAAIAATDTGPFLFTAGTYKVSSNITITNAVTFHPGAILKPDSGVTITFSVPFTAGEYQIFDMSAGGSVVGANQGEWHARWFGAVGDDSTDNSTFLTYLHAAVQGSRNANAVWGAGIFRFGSAGTIGAANQGCSLIGVPMSALQQGSANSPCVFKWTGGASIMLTVDGFSTIEGISFQNFGTGTYALKLNSAERLRMPGCSFGVPSGASAWSTAAVWFASLNYAAVDHCEFVCAPAVKLSGAGTRLEFNQCVFDCPVGASPVITADVSCDMVTFPGCTFNTNTGGKTFWDNSGSSSSVGMLDLSGMEFDGGGISTPTVIKAKNIGMVRLHASKVDNYGSLTDYFATLTNSRMSIRGITGTSISPGVAKTLDTTSYVFVEEHNLTPSNVPRMVEDASQSGMYIPVTIGADVANVARLRGELASPMCDTVYAITPANTTAFTITTAAYSESAPGWMTPGQRFAVLIRNALGGGGAIGAITWGATFKMGGAFTNPADGFSRAIWFVWNGTNAVELGRGAADVAN